MQCHGKRFVRIAELDKVIRRMRVYGQTAEQIMDETVFLAYSENRSDHFGVFGENWQQE